MLEKAKKFIKDKGIYVQSLVELSNTSEKIEVLNKARDLQNIYSVSKSITATAIGLLEFQKKINLDDKVKTYLGEFFPDNYEKKWDNVRIKHLLSQTIGEENGYLFSDEAYKIENPNWLEHVFSQELKYKVGEKMTYSNTNFYISSRIVEKITGTSLFNFLIENLFSPLDFLGYGSQCCPLGYTYGASGFFLRTIDMAKIGMIYLNKGYYNGKAFLSEEFITSASNAVTYDHGSKRYYGYSFWRSDKNTPIYYADGAHGQFIIINPELNKVLAVQSYDAINSTEFVDYVTKP